MRRVAFFVLSLLILAGWTQVYAQAEDPATLEPVVLADGQDVYPLALHLELLEDPGGELTIDDVSSPEFDAQFVPNQDEAINYGFTESAYWVRLHLRNEARLTDRWLLDVGFANMHFVDLYTPLANGDGFQVKQTGSLRDPGTRDIRHPRIVLYLTIPSQSEQTIYLRFQNGGPMILPLALWQPDAFADQALEEQVTAGVFFGIVLGLLFYHLFLFFSLREAPYLYLVLLLIGVAAFEASQANYLELYLLPSLYHLKQHSIALATALVLISIVLLHDSFLTAKKLFPSIYRMDMVLVGVWAVLALFTFFVSYHDLASVMAPLIVVTLSASSLALIVAWPRGFRANRALIIALLGLFASILFFILGRLGVISNVGFTENLFRIGFISLAVCWSLALADRVNTLKSETEEANLELSSSERRLAQILEGLPLGVVVYDTNQKPTYENKRVSEILANPAQGIKPDLSAGRTLAQAMKYYSFRVTGSDRDYPFESIPVYRALQGERASVDNIEADLVDWRVPLEIWASPVLDDEGNVESAVVAFQDITVRKQSEMALQASERKFRVVVENAFDGIVFMASDRKVLYVSPSYARLNGMNIEDMIGKTGVGFVHPDDRARIAEVFGELLQRPAGKSTVEYRSRHQNGSWFWVETNAVNLLDDPQVGAVVLNIRDISERKQTEAELTAYHKHLERIVEERTEELSDSNERLKNEIIEREMLAQLLYWHIEWLTALHKVRQVIGGTTDLPQAYDQLTATILRSQAAKAVFLLNWGDHGGHVVSIYHLQRDDSTFDMEGLVSIFEKDSSLRKEIELGQPIPFTVGQDATLPAPLGDLLRESDIQSLVLMPMIAGRTVAGVFGLASPRPVQDFSPARLELVATMVRDLAELAEDAQLVSQARALVAAEERNRLARDLHDSVTQVLFSASLVAEVLPQIWRRDPEKALQSVEELRRLTRGALAEMRTMLLELRPSSVLKTPLPELLAQLTEATTTRIELPFRLFVQKIPALPEDVHTGFYRIAQEALNNVVKHAQASQVTVSLSAAPLAPNPAGNAGWTVESGVLHLKWATPLAQDQAASVRYEVKLVIEDDGVGFSLKDEGQEHLGLGIMRERAAAIQATLSIDSRPGAGTQVILTWCNQSQDPS